MSTWASAPSSELFEQRRTDAVLAATLQLPLTKPQEEFALSPAPYPAMVAGLGSGKTQAAIARLLILMLQESGINTAMYLPTYDLLRLRAMPGAEEMLTGLGVRFVTNNSQYHIKIARYGTMYFRSYDNPNRIVSYEVAHSCVDELDTLKKDKAEYVWRKVSERNRQRCRNINTMGNVTTPDQGLQGFTYQRWGKNEDRNKYPLIKARTDSNPFLPPGYIEQIRENYDPILAELYLAGEFVSLSRDKVYHFFDRHKHHTDRVLTERDKVIHIGLDFNVGGTCATVWLLEGQKAFAVDEFVSHDTQDFVLRANKAYRYCGEKKGAPKRKIIVHPDSTGKNRSTNASVSDIQIIEQGGLIVDAAKVNPVVRDRINCANGHFAHERALVNTERCSQLTEALETQGYDDKGEPEKFNDHPSIDDWVDGMGYFMHRRMPLAKPIATTNIRSAA